MAQRLIQTFAAGVVLAGFAASIEAGNLRAGLQTGTPEIRSAGPLAFGPDGILFVGDTKSAAIFAIDTSDAAKAKSGKVNIEGIDGQIAAALGTSADQIVIEDMAVNPASGSIYLSVSRGNGPDAQPVLLRVVGGQLEEVPLDQVAFAKVELENAPADSGSGRQNQRREAITDLAFIDGRLIVAGLSNEEFASKLRAIPFPFDEADEGASVEIFHGAHGKFETRSPVRTFVPFEVDGKPHLIAAYTCTPLVTFPVAALDSDEKIRGTTVAELGNRNRPLDMIVYSRGGKNFLLMANSARGMMKIPTEGIGDAEGIEEKIDGTAGVKYDTIPGMEGVLQLDRLDDTRAVVIVQRDGRTDLATIDMP